MNFQPLSPTIPSVRHLHIEVGGVLISFLIFEHLGVDILIWADLSIWLVLQLITSAVFMYGLWTYIVQIVASRDPDREPQVEFARRLIFADHSPVSAFAQGGLWSFIKLGFIAPAVVKLVSLAAALSIAILGGTLSLLVVGLTACCLTSTQSRQQVRHAVQSLTRPLLY